MTQRKIPLPVGAIAARLARVQAFAQPVDSEPKKARVKHLILTNYARTNTQAYM